MTRSPVDASASDRLRLIADLAPGYAAALLNLAGEIEAAARFPADGTPEAAHAGMSDEDWLIQISAAILD